MAKTKGISLFVSYVLAILLAVLVIAGVSILVYGFYRTLLEDGVKREMTQLAAQTSSKITELYSIAGNSKTTPSNFASVLLAETQLNLPPRVASKVYQLTLVTENQISAQLSNILINDQNITVINEPQTSKIIIQTTEDPFVEIEYEIPSVGIGIQGRSDNPANATLRYYRYNLNESIIDTILLGDYSLVGQITIVG